MFKHRHVGVDGHRFFEDKEREINCRILEWAMHLSGEDSIFTTLTFKYPVTLVRGRKIRRRWLARVSQGLIDKEGNRLRSNDFNSHQSEALNLPRMKSVCASEWQKREVIHYHLVIVGNGVGNLSRKSLESRWESLGGGYARCYDAEYGAALYLAKYTSKELQGDLEWDGAWSGYNFPGSLSRLCVGAPTEPG